MCTGLAGASAPVPQGCRQGVCRLRPFLGRDPLPSSLVAGRIRFCGCMTEAPFSCQPSARGLSPPRGAQSSLSHGPLAAHKLSVCFLPGHQECPPDFPSPPACPSGALRNTTQSPCSQRPPTLEGSTPRGGVLGTMLGFCLPSSDELDLDTKTNLGPGSVPDLGCDLGEFSPHPLKQYYRLRF